jgi:hypothetical protein
VNCPQPLGDGGGAFNAGYIICYSPTAAPTLNTLGTIQATGAIGTVKSPANISSVPQAMACLYLTALNYINGDFNSAYAQMQKNNAIPTGATASNFTLLA